MLENHAIERHPMRTPLNAQGKLDQLLSFVEAHPEKFRPDFADWLKANPVIWMEFDKHATELRQAGRRNFSARTIIEVIRWNSAIRSKGDIFKINNNWAPDLARLFLMLHPEANGLFSLRDSTLRAN